MQASQSLFQIYKGLDGLDLNKIKDTLNAAETMRISKNFFYETHSCAVHGSQVKVMLDYKLMTEQSDKIIKFGACPYCNDVFYHDDFESKSL